MDTEGTSLRSRSVRKGESGASWLIFCCFSMRKKNACPRDITECPRVADKTFEMQKNLKTLGNIRKFLRIFVDFLGNVSIILTCMDTQKSSLTADSIDLSGVSGSRVVVGAKQLRKALNKGSARRVYLARNADPAITEPLAALCQQNSVEFSWVRSMADLGNACGIEVGAATAAVVD